VDLFTELQTLTADPRFSDPRTSNVYIRTG